ncbi:MAG: glycerophosphodiester phosphodiesterase family protein [Paracholeplasma sp.]|nr:glycerophosphodiester phosphodiesterase family protein [Paracholeplasma sp.]MDY3196519.1 glycerophosphodiester phosphodiesterase family protein [Paracholeplasma sp.]
MKKLFILLTLFGMSMMTQKSVQAETELKVISSTQNAILADVGDVILLSDYIYQHNTNTALPLSDVTLTSFSTGIAIDATSITVSEVGQHPFLLQHESANIYVYVIAKAPTDTEYILFETGFDGLDNGKLPNGYQTISGSAGIQNEQLLVAGRGGSSLVALPNYLRNFMNYIIEVDMTIVEVDNDSRWASVMFRYQTENYYQMAIRKDATLSNGVEFAKRVSGNWNVTNTASFTESLSPAKMYALKIDVLDSVIKEYMDGTLLITHEQALEYKRGLIGVQATGANAVFDNFKITLPMSYIRTETFEFTQIPTIYEPTTSIVNPATTLVPLKSLAQLSEYLTERPATLILTVNQSLEVIDDSNQTIDTLYNVLKVMDGKMIPAIKATDTIAAIAVAERLKLWGILDVYIISSDKEIILQARTEYQMIRGILDLTDRSFNTHTDLDQIRRDVNSAQSVAVILNSNDITKESVNYLQQRLVTVFTHSSENTALSHYNAILSGVNGIVTDYPFELFDIYETFVTTTHVREVFLIAHRGLHNGYTESAGPENSIEVALKAIEHGAKILETDVHLTFDQEVIVIHDTTTNRTTSQQFTVSQQLIGALENITLTDVSNTGNTFYMPSFDRYLETFKGLDVVLFIEIKPIDTLLLEKVRDMVLEKDMENQVVLITFGAQNIVDMQTVMPSMVNGYLTGSLLNSASVSSSMLNVLTSIVPMKSTLNPSYGQLTLDFVKALTHRGITVWPWTVDDQNSLNYYHTAGVGGITTNVTDYMTNAYLYLEYEQTDIKHKIGDPLSISGNLKTMSGDAYPFRSQLVILKNDANASFDNAGNLLDVEKTGDVLYYTKASTTLPNGSVIELYSDVMSITFIKPSSILSNPWLYVSTSGGLLLAIGIWFTLKKVNKK